MRILIFSKVVKEVNERPSKAGSIGTPGKLRLELLSIPFFDRTSDK